MLDFFILRLCFWFVFGLYVCFVCGLGLGFVSRPVGGRMGVWVYCTRFTRCTVRDTMYEDGGLGLSVSARRYVRGRRQWVLW